jgi:drug/metabolite transporter (DMT)-like permease
MPELLPGPALLALFAAALFGLQAVLARRSLSFVDAQTGTMISIVTAALIFWAIAPWKMRAEFWLTPAVWIFGFNGLIHPTVSMYLSFEANKRMGPTVSSSVAATTPMFATAGAVAGLGEPLSAEILLGTCAVVAGVIGLSWRRGGVGAWPLAALFFPLGAAVVRAFNHVWTRFGLGVLDDPHFALTVSFSVAAVVSLAAWLQRSRTRKKEINFPGLFWGVASGVTVAVAVGAMYVALSTGLVVVVSPLINTYPLFAMALALLVGQEFPNLRILIGVVLIVGGVTLISL